MAAIAVALPQGQVVTLLAQRRDVRFWDGQGIGEDPRCEPGHMTAILRIELRLEVNGTIPE
jgi:hypothetical protein